MAHFAQIDKDNKVIQVIVVNNDVINNLPFPESEPVGVSFCRSLFGDETNWVQTSYNATFRYNYAGIDHTFDEAATPYGAFIAQKPFASWILNANIYQWEAPIPYPNDGERYIWDESTLSWVLIQPQAE